MSSIEYHFDNPKREEWRLPNKLNETSGEVEVVRHRDNDEPAVISAKGYKAWYKNGLRHRDNELPAIDFEEFKAYYQDGKLHKTNGPALEFSDGTCQYWVNGVKTN